MKKFLMLLVVAAMTATSIDAQIVTSRSRKITYNEVKSDYENWSELTFSPEFGSYSYDDDEDSQSFTSLKLGWARAFALSSSTPLFLRPGADLQYSFWSDEYNKYEVKVKYLSIAPACDFGYLVNFGGSSVSLFPYVGLTMRANLWGQETYEYGDESEDYDLFASDEGDCKRFQMGIRAGLDAHFGKFIVGFSYGTDFMEFADDTTISGFSLKVGVKL